MQVQTVRVVDLKDSDLHFYFRFNCGQLVQESDPRLPLTSANHTSELSVPYGHQNTLTHDRNTTYD